MNFPENNQLVKMFKYEYNLISELSQPVQDDNLFKVYKIFNEKTTTPGKLQFTGP